jgi:hypothetical protein
MAFVTILLLIALGILGVASWLKVKRPDMATHLKPLEAVEGWIGIAGLVLGLYTLIMWIRALGIFSLIPGRMLVLLACALAIISLSLILAMPVLRTLMGSSDFTNKLAETANRLAPLKMALGVTCLVLAVLSLVSMF